MSDTTTFIYDLKKAINAKILQDPAVHCDMVEIISDGVEDKFGKDNIKLFSVVDNTIKIEIYTNGEKSYVFSMRDIIENSVYKFCSLYHTAIGLALLDICSRDSYNQFNLLMDNEYTKTLAELIYSTEFMVGDTYVCTLRLF